MSSIEPTAAHYAPLIAECWHKTTDTILQVARLCTEASEKLSGRERAVLIRLLPFSASTFSKLAAIGKHPRFKEEGISLLAPPNYSTMYTITKLTDAQFDTAKKRGLLGPSAKRADLELLRRVQNRQDDTLPKPPLKLATVFVHADCDPNKRALLVDKLEHLKGKYGCIVVPWVDPLDRAEEVQANRYNRFIVKECRAVVRKARAEWKCGPYKHRPFPPNDEVEILDDASPERLRDVLEDLGKLDAYEAIMKRAGEVDVEPLESKFAAVDGSAGENGTEEVAQSIREFKERKTRKRSKDTFKGWT